MIWATKRTRRRKGFGSRVLRWLGQVQNPGPLPTLRVCLQRLGTSYEKLHVATMALKELHADFFGLGLPISSKPSATLATTPPVASPTQKGPSK